MRSKLEYVPYLLSNVVAQHEVNLKPLFSFSLTQLTVHQLQLIIKRATNEEQLILKQVIINLAQLLSDDKPPGASSILSVI